MHKLLIIAPRIPFFDRNAGDWRVFSLCELFAERVSVYYLPLQHPGGNEFYLRALQGRNVNVLLPHHNDVPHFLDLLNQHQLTTVLFEWFYSTDRFLQFIPHIERVIIDTHELQYIKAERRSRVLGYADRVVLEQNKQHELGVYRLANELITVSDEERLILQAWFPKKKIVTIPTVVQAATRTHPDYHRRRDIAFFGSFYNSAMNPNIDAVDYFIREIQPLVQRMLPCVRFHVLGYGADSLPYAGIERKTDIEDIEKALGEYRVFVCPLRYGAGAKKKVLDAANAGTPVVATNIGKEGVAFEEDNDILIADNPADFAQKVVTLYQNADLWNKISTNGRNKINTRYSVKALRKNLEQENVLEELLGLPDRREP
jgi:glycosyltransferase involved in cell wall biosynthesis